MIGGNTPSLWIGRPFAELSHFIRCGVSCPYAWRASAATTLPLKHAWEKISMNQLDSLNHNLHNHNEWKIGGFDA